jgi:hypothetical protein
MWLFLLACKLDLKTSKRKIESIAAACDELDNHRLHHRARVNVFEMVNRSRDRVEPNRYRVGVIDSVLVICCD